MIKLRPFTLAEADLLISYLNDPHYWRHKAALQH